MSRGMATSLQRKGESMLSRWLGKATRCCRACPCNTHASSSKDLMVLLALLPTHHSWRRGHILHNRRFCKNQAFCTRTGQVTDTVCAPYTLVDPCKHHASQDSYESRLWCFGECLGVVGCEIHASCFMIQSLSTGQHAQTRCSPAAVSTAMRYKRPNHHLMQVESCNRVCCRCKNCGEPVCLFLPASADVPLCP